MEIKSEDIIMQWALRWAAMNISRFVKGEDGKTAYERWKGKRFTMEEIEFGEKIHYRMNMKNKTQQENLNTTQNTSAPVTKWKIIFIGRHRLLCIIETLAELCCFLRVQTTVYLPHFRSYVSWFCNDAERRHSLRDTRGV